MKFSHSFRVQPGDIDAQGHANNVTYLRWIQDIAVAHWLHAATEEQQAEFVWVVVRHEIDYKKQAFINEEITVTTWVGEWTKVTCERFTEITRRDDLLARGRTIWCIIGRQTARPVRIASDLIDRFN